MQRPNPVFPQPHLQYDFGDRHFAQRRVQRSAGGNDPTPAAVKSGRGFLYDAKLSGNGTGACAACHIDSDRDHLAWDLGDPSGNMTSTVQRGRTILFHPMKGPMSTQPLRGLLNLAPYHWRGDKPNLSAFNAAFPSLMGGPQISDADMTTYATFLNSVLYLPNPYQELDRTMPNSLAGGFPNKGRTDFLTLRKTGAGEAPATGVTRPTPARAPIW